MFLLVIPQHKGYKCFHPPTRKIYVSVDVTFNEKTSYFSTSYLPGEITMEDKGKDLFLFDLTIPTIPAKPVPPPHIAPTSDHLDEANTETIFVPKHYETVSVPKHSE